MDFTFNLDPNTIMSREATELVSVEIHLQPSSLGARLKVRLQRDEPDGISSLADGIELG